MPGFEVTPVTVPRCLASMDHPLLTWDGYVALERPAARDREGRLSEGVRRGRAYKLTTERRGLRRPSPAEGEQA